MSSSAAAAGGAGTEPESIDVSEALAAERAHRGMDLAQLCFKLGVSDEYVPDKAAVRAEIMKHIEEDCGLSRQRCVCDRGCEHCLQSRSQPRRIHLVAKAGRQSWVAASRPARRMNSLRSNQPLAINCLTPERSLSPLCSHGSAV